MLSWAFVLGANLVVAPLGALLVPLWARLSRAPWRDLGFTRPKHLARDLALCLAAGAALKLLLQTLVVPLVGGPPINPRCAVTSGDPAAAVRSMASVLIVASV